jgi:putative transposase
VKKSRFTESQILTILTEGGSGIPVAEVCRKLSNPTYYQWKSKYAGMSLPELKRVKELEA